GGALGAWGRAFFLGRGGRALAGRRGGSKWCLVGVERAGAGALLQPPRRGGEVARAIGSEERTVRGRGVVEHGKVPCRHLLTARQKAAYSWRLRRLREQCDAYLVSGDAVVGDHHLIDGLRCFAGEGLAPVLSGARFIGRGGLLRTGVATEEIEAVGER